MRCGLDVFPKFLLILLFGGFFSLYRPAVFAQANFNITPLGNHRPLSGKDYGDVWGEDNIACLGIWLGYSSSSTPYGVGIYDISDPTEPTLLSTYLAASASHNQFEQGVVRNKIGYFASWSGGGVHIVSLTNPSSPQTLSIINTASNGFSRVHTMFLERDFLYEAAHVNNEQRVKIFDVSNPFAPIFLQDVVTTNTYKVHQITAAQKGANTILYTSGWGNGGSLLGQTDMWDVTNVGTEPAQWLGRIFSGFSSHSSWPTPDGNSLVVCRETTGGEVRIYDISNPAAPTLQSEISPASMGLEADLPHNPVIVGNLLFVSWFQKGIQIFDITDRTKPVRIGSYDTYPNPRSANFQGNWGVYPLLGLNKVLLSDIQTGLWVVDASGILTGTNNYAPLLVQSPAGQTVAQGTSVTFTPVITGSLLNYQWKLNGTNVSGATASSYTIPFAQPFHSGNYTVAATNASGAVTSVSASLSVSVHASAPVITAQPDPVSVYPEQSANFSVAISGEAPFFYQWRFQGTDIPNETNATFIIPSVQTTQVGNYSVLVTNSFGGVTSSNALLSIIDSPYISAVVAHPGLQSAIISWNTTLPTDAKVDFGPMEQGSITGTSPRDTVLSTNHSVLLTGLQPGTTYNYQVVSRAGGTNFLSGVYQFTTFSAEPIIVDNADITKVSFVGSWTSSTNVKTYYGSNYRWASTISVALPPDRTATFTPHLPVSGNYDVDAWYAASPDDRATNAPFTISYNGGNTVVRMNQKINGGQWNSLATQLPFSSGTSGFVQLGNNAFGGNVVIADAVRFTYTPNQEFPSNGTVPAWWSEFYFETPIDPSIDHDGDGFTTGQEYILGTSPTSTNHGLNVRVFRSGGTANVIFHPMHADRTYTLQQRSDLTGSTWQTVEIESSPAGPDGDGVFSLELNSATQNFYRISVELSPTSPAHNRTSGERRMFVGAFEEPGCGPTRIYAQ
ncbi:MAG: fibronectin type III domain-containing protein [Verrucomicrobia bacterium]|nr:fibronectin type III domain-containing protein [Verrucomicrobiota bacterium]